jgi:hypothetical protein
MTIDPDMVRGKESAIPYGVQSGRLIIDPDMVRGKDSTIPYGVP